MEVFPSYSNDSLSLDVYKDNSVSLVFLEDVFRESFMQRRVVQYGFTSTLTIYNDMFYNMRNKKFDNSKNFTVLFVYTNTWYNVFARPQQYELLTNEIVTLHEKTRELAKLAKNLPDKYLFMPFPDFYHLNEKVWYTPDGNKISLVL